MVDNSESFKSELKALMEKYNIQMDFIADRAKVNFYTDFGRSRAVTLQFDLDTEVLETAADSIT